MYMIMVMTKVFGLAMGFARYMLTFIPALLQDLWHTPKISMCGEQIERG